MGAEILLWLLFIVPGVLYSIWRLSSRCTACEKCHAPNLIPMDSPRGRQLVQELHGTTPQAIQQSDVSASAARGRMYLAIIGFVIAFLVYRAFS